MSITKKDVEHIAHLARIKLSDEEKRKFEKELSAILLFVEKLNEVNAESVEPLSGGTDLESVMREDRQIDLDLEKKSGFLVASAPETKEHWIRVKAVFGQ